MKRLLLLVALLLPLLAPAMEQSRSVPMQNNLQESKNAVNVENQQNQASDYLGSYYFHPYRIAAALALVSPSSWRNGLYNNSRRLFPFKLTKFRPLSYAILTAFSGAVLEAALDGFNKDEIITKRTTSKLKDSSNENPLFITLKERHQIPKFGPTKSSYRFFLHKNELSLCDNNPDWVEHIGYADISCSQNSSCWLDWLEINPKERKKGYGSLLLRQIGDCLEKNNYKSIWGIAIPIHLKEGENASKIVPRLYSFYEKMGAQSFYTNFPLYSYKFKKKSNKKDIK